MRLEVSLSEFTNKRNRKYPMYKMTKKGFMFMVMQSSGAKSKVTRDLVIEKQGLFIDAFEEMQRLLTSSVNELTNIHSLAFYPKDEFGKESEVNGLARTEAVKGYFRSDKNSELSVIFSDVKKLQKRLGGFFDDEVNVMIDVKLAEAKVVKAKAVDTKRLKE